MAKIRDKNSYYEKSIKKQNLKEKRIIKEDVGKSRIFTQQNQNVNKEV